ncbi:MAG TPA: sensor histidine kinase [Sphingomicrobium sp.]|nr:sensor histidine kinase [Sphingomicrobium sp.]
MPQRIATVPPILVEIAVGLTLPVVMVGLRMPLNGFAGDRAPYAFMFIGVALATLLAGWRAGVVAVIAGQALAWNLVVASETSPEVHGAFVLATFSELVIVLIIALYQREVDKGTQDREQRLALLDEALSEIDHRTRNNYQTVLAMIDLQARRAGNAGARDALRQVSDRIQAIANASRQLAVRSADIGRIRLDDHLCGLVEQIERGLSRDGIHVDCDVDEVTADADKATSISIIVNELVTNAIKHAFNGEGSGRVRVSGRSGQPFELVVEDDGSGIGQSRRTDSSGLGSKLVESFARQLGAKHQVTSSDRGTTHRLLIPALD